MNVNVKLKLTIDDSKRDRFTRWALAQKINPYQLDYQDISHCPADLILEGLDILTKGRDQLSEVLGRLADPSDPHFLVELSNLPLDELSGIPSPIDGRVPESKTFVSELASIVLAHVMDTRIRVGHNEKHPFDLPFHQVVPQPGYEREGSNRGAGYFPAHQDRIFVPNPPDFLMLYGLRGENSQDVKTYFYLLQDLLEGMPEDLYHELFCLHFRDPESDKIISILQGDPNDPSSLTSRLDLAEGWIHPITQKSQDALVYLQGRNRDHCHTFPSLKSVILSPGTAVLADHRRSLHWRNGFETNYNRWLQRMHLLKR